MKELVCALTGHRDLPANFDRDALLADLEDLIKEGYTTFLCGMARGFDLVSLGCLVELKQRYHVRIKAYIPFAGQERIFPQEDKDEYYRLLPWCDEKKVLFHNYFSGCFIARNRLMVEACDMLYAYLTKSDGGTAYTVRLAKSKNVRVKLFHFGEKLC